MDAAHATPASETTPEALLPHPSRSAPLCCDCRHAQKSFSDLKCNLPQAPVDLAHGYPLLYVSRARAANSRLCGPEGRRFEPKS
jgi:hypothetical protein